MAISREISHHFIKKWTLETPCLEILLWLKEKKDKKRKIISLKCKGCIKFQSETNSMSMFKKTWIDDYGEGRLVSLKYHCNGKPHVKALLSLKGSVLMPDKVGQIVVDMSVSLNEFRRLKRKADIAYFAAKMLYRPGSYQI